MARSLAGRMFLPGEDGYDAARRGFELSVESRPAVVVAAAGAEDVAAAVRFAMQNGLGIGVLAAGHGPVVAADGGVLINTGGMHLARVDPARRTAWVGAGATWAEVLTETAVFGLAPLVGSAPRVGAVGYTLGGGLGPLGRRFGFAADLLRAVDLVSVDGQARRVDTERDPDLFWALRGGGGNFGVVTAMQIELVPLTGIYGGGLYFSGDVRDAVLHAAWNCAEQAPDDLTLSVAVVTFPDVAPLPTVLRGRHIVHVRVAACGEPARAERLLAPLRATAVPVADTLRVLPISEIGAIHGDPTTARATRSRTLALRRVDSATLGVLARHSGPDALSMVEIRPLGGALARASSGTAVGHRTAAASVYTSAYPDQVTRPGSAAAQEALISDLRPWSDGGALVNFLTGAQVTPSDVQAAYRPADWSRLIAVKRAWDPQNILRFNNNIPAV